MKVAGVILKASSRQGEMQVKYEKACILLSFTWVRLSNEVLNIPMPMSNNTLSLRILLKEHGIRVRMKQLEDEGCCQVLSSGHKNSQQICDLH